METVAYFCAAELIANAAKYSHASAVEVTVDGQRGQCGWPMTGWAEPIPWPAAGCPASRNG